ncbi:hypothetical protein AAJ72_08895 [Citromicrobium sp. RCC1885]|uniref:hypothetical protein n=1 Tax=unclassified Citromicrobium TaxID=2630544 RepID=UPI0006C8FD72|nr:MULTISPECIES: hypothetical protein [unclassified Citromicrobium]KPM23030.1 hypothetical protein AAJ72_08895 [Citromicrobium sp. RCC1885]KPM27172.1 hypothetical protein AAJ74_09635 [Citromicrobium sp. RCC1878]OAM09057.1 hypothetical protein A0U43_10665 [Citromicrobium sp. RCC1897]
MNSLAIIYLLGAVGWFAALFPAMRHGALSRWTAIIPALFWPLAFTLLVLVLVVDLILGLRRRPR